MKLILNRGEFDGLKTQTQEYWDGKGYKASVRIVCVSGHWLAFVDSMSDAISIADFIDQIMRDISIGVETITIEISGREATITPKYFDETIKIIPHEVTNEALASNSGNQ